MTSSAPTAIVADAVVMQKTTMSPIGNLSTTDIAFQDTAFQLTSTSQRGTASHSSFVRLCKEAAVALLWVVGYLTVLSLVGLGVEPMTGNDIGGNPLMNTLQNNLMIIVIAGLFGMVWAQVQHGYERGLIVAAAVGVIGWFTYLQAPMLAGLYADYGWWQTQLGLAPHMLLELGAFVVLIRNPGRWRWVVGTVVIAAMVETWVTPWWVSLLRLTNG